MVRISKAERKPFLVFRGSFRRCRFVHFFCICRLFFRGFGNTLPVAFCRRLMRLSIRRGCRFSQFCATVRFVKPTSFKDHGRRREAFFSFSFAEGAWRILSVAGMILLEEVPAIGTFKIVEWHRLYSSGFSLGMAGTAHGAPPSPPFSLRFESR